MKTCPKCGKELADSLNICTACGTKVSEPEKPENLMQTPKEPPKYYKILLPVVAVLGAILIIAVNTWFGLILYGVSFALSLLELKKDGLFETTDYVGYFKSCFTKENLPVKGVYAGVVVALPIIVILAFLGWLVWEPARAVDAIYDEYNDAINDIYDQYGF